LGEIRPANGMVKDGARLGGWESQASTRLSFWVHARS